MTWGLKMKSNRYGITLGFDMREEVEKGVFESDVIEKKVKAEEMQVYQKRLNEAELEGFVVSARFRVRNYHIDKKLKYVTFKGLKYKVNSIYNDINSHSSEIEIGELV